MEPTSFIMVCRLLAASQVLLTAAALLRSPNPLQVRLVLAGLGLGVLSYLLLPLVGAWGGRISVWLLPILFSNAVPMFLWAACLMFFNDDASLPRLGVAAAALAIVLVAFGQMRAAVGALEGAELIVLRWLPQLMKLGFTVLAIRVALVGREADLVEPRRRARRWFAVGLGGLVAAVIGTELATAFAVPGWLEGFGMFAMFALTLSLNLVLFPPHPAFELKDPPQAIGSGTNPLLLDLERHMQEERAYADHDLRIAGLAATLCVPEHRLRRAINGELGYRNFNQYINGHRIDEAARRLRDEHGLPILTIALDVGFRSLSAFNKAFRDAKGCTPTDYRLLEHLTDSWKP